MTGKKYKTHLQGQLTNALDSNPVLAQSYDNCGGSIMHIEFLVECVQSIFHDVRTDAERLSDLFIGRSSGNLFKNRLLLS